MYVLATYPGHDASVAIVGNGSVVHLEKERFTRRKHDHGDISALIPIALRQARITAEQIVAWAKIGPDENGKTFSGGICHSEQSTIEFEGRTIPLFFLPHHLAHASYAFYSSPFQYADIITADGGGDDCDGKLVDSSIGSAEHKFGTSERAFKLEPCNEPSPGHGWTNLSHELFGDGWSSGKVMALAGLRRGVLPEPWTQIGFSLDQFGRTRDLQDDTVRWFDDKRKHCTRSIVVAGGCALNGPAMYRMLSDHPQGVHVPPAVHDGGLTIGAAMWVLHQELGVRRVGYGHQGAFAGYSDDTLDGKTWPDHGRIVEALARGKVVCIARGRAESGPRALGNRSIIASPTAPGIKDRLNDMKGRQRWRPVAPVVEFSQARRLFGNLARASLDTFQYMTFVPRVPYEVSHAFPAAVHNDQSARLQTVNDGSSIGRIVGVHRELTGVPLLLNTSFNCGNEAIVNDAEQAVDTFRRLGADMLVIGDRIVEERE